MYNLFEYFLNCISNILFISFGVYRNYSSEVLRCSFTFTSFINSYLLCVQPDIGIMQVAIETACQNLLILGYIAQ